VRAKLAASAEGNATVGRGVRARATATGRRVASEESGKAGETLGQIPDRAPGRARVGLPRRQEPKQCPEPALPFALVPGKR